MTIDTKEKWQKEKEMILEDAKSVCFNLAVIFQKNYDVRMGEFVKKCWQSGEKARPMMLRFIQRLKDYICSGDNIFLSKKKFQSLITVILTI